MNALYSGSCHCGRVRFEVEWDPAADEIIECNCSICRRKGFLHLIVAPERFRLLSGEESLQTYRFNSGTAVHRFCRECGIHPFYTPRSHPHDIDVNVRCLDGIDLDALVITHFDGQNWEANVESIR